MLLLYLTYKELKHSILGTMEYKLSQVSLYLVTDDRFCPKPSGIFCPESDGISVRQRLLFKFLADIFL